MSAHQTAAVHVRGHNFTADFLPLENKLPTLLRLFLSEYPDDVLRIIDEDTLVLIRVECQKRQREQEAYIARCIEHEQVEA